MSRLEPNGIMMPLTAITRMYRAGNWLVHHRGDQSQIEQRLEVEECEARLDAPDVGVQDRDGRHDHGGQRRDGDDENGHRRDRLEVEGRRHEHHDGHRDPPQVHPAQQAPHRRRPAGAHPAGIRVRPTFQASHGK
jgi:hypothetical protein